MEKMIDRDQAHARSVEDLTRQAEFAKLATQLLFTANGGAALAMLSFLASIATSATVNSSLNIAAVYSGFATAASAFLGGLFLCILSIAFNSLSKQRFSWYWEEIAVREDNEMSKRYRRSGKIWRVCAQIFFAVSLVAFVAGSYLAISAFI